jgi:hypothetical protein
VSEVIPADELVQRTQEVAELFAAMPTRAVWETKRLLDAAETSTFEQQLELEAVTQQEMTQTDDFDEGVAAFLAKREAHFTGAATDRHHPVILRNRDDRRRWRLTTLLRIVLALPHYYLVEYWGIVAVVVAIVNWFIALARGRTPNAVHDYLARYVRYYTHVFAYIYLLADPYPRFRGWEGTYPIDLHIAPPAPQSRWKIGFRLPLAVPALIFAYVLGIVAGFVALLSWFVALAVARVPAGFQGLGAYCLRYQAQTYAYVFLLTDTYPTLASGSFEFESSTTS